MSAVAWVGVSAAIALLGLVYLVFHARAVWRKVRLLLAEVDTAVRRAEEASEAVRRRAVADGT